MNPCLTDSSLMKMVKVMKMSQSIIEACEKREEKETEDEEQRQTENRCFIKSTEPESEKSENSQHQQFFTGLLQKSIKLSLKTQFIYYLDHTY